MKCRALFCKAWTEMYLSHPSQCGGEACRIIGTFQREGCLVENVKKKYFQKRVIRRLSFLLDNIPGLLKTPQAPLTAELLTLLWIICIIMKLNIINQYHALMEIKNLKQGCYVVKYCKYLRVFFLCFFAHLHQLHFLHALLSFLPGCIVSCLF